MATTLQAVIIVRDQNEKGIGGAVLSSSAGSGIANLYGMATLSFPSSQLNQELTVSISASGFQSTSTLVQVTQFPATINVQMVPVVSTTPTVINLTDGTNPIVGASVFLNGVSLGASSATGAISLPLQAGNNTLQITSVGYQGYETRSLRFAAT